MVSPFDVDLGITLRALGVGILGRVYVARERTARGDGPERSVEVALQEANESTASRKNPGGGCLPTRRGSR